VNLYILYISLVIVDGINLLILYWVCHDGFEYVRIVLPFNNSKALCSDMNNCSEKNNCSETNNNLLQASSEKNWKLFVLQEVG